MLKELHIENLALIEYADIPFSNHFNVFTGETGAGKSMLINGINAVLGQRTSKDLVRNGCDKAIITALFTDLFELTREKLDEYGISYDDNQLVISREILSDGGSIARINSKPANISVVKEIGETLVNVHGQHDNQILLSPEKHLHILDSYANLTDKLLDYQQQFKLLQSVSRKLKELKTVEKEKKERLYVLSQKIEDISSLDIKENEDTIIENEYKLSKNSVDINSSVMQLLQILCTNESNDSFIDKIDLANNNISKYSEIMPQLKNISERINSVKIELQDICSELENILDLTEYSKERYDYLLDRRQKLYNIKIKYGPDISDVINTLNESLNEYENLTNNENSINELIQTRQKLLIEVSHKAEKLSEIRKKFAKIFSEQVKEQLQFLDMPDVKIEFRFEEGKLTLQGLDSVELMVSANIGEPLKPINKIASGGELSRIMLAIKNVIAEKDEIPTMIFDEIDTGVSGRAAQKIGIKLRQIASFRQVICVTHLSQIAVNADNHLLIEKESCNHRTKTNVKALTSQQRVQEIARILCGDNVSETALKNAEELLKCNRSV